MRIQKIMNLYIFLTRCLLKIYLKCVCVRLKVFCLYCRSIHGCDKRYDKYFINIISLSEKHLLFNVVATQHKYNILYSNTRCRKCGPLNMARQIWVTYESRYWTCHSLDMILSLFVFLVNYLTWQLMTNIIDKSYTNLLRVQCHYVCSYLC